MNIAILFRFYLIIACTALIVGCDYIDWLTDNYVPPPQAAADELMLFGITLSPEQGKEFPASDVVNANLVQSPRGEPYVDVSRLGLYFSPDLNHINVQDYGDIAFSRHFPYRYVFVEDRAGVREEIPGNELPVNDFTNIDYVGKVRIQHYPEEFILLGDHFLEGVIGGFPARATHIELWFQDNSDEAPTMILNVRLNQLIAWRMYVEPLLLSGD